MEKIICPSCGTFIEADQSICPVCSASLIATPPISTKFIQVHTGSTSKSKSFKPTKWTEPDSVSSSTMKANPLSQAETKVSSPSPPVATTAEAETAPKKAAPVRQNSAAIFLPEDSDEEEIEDPSLTGTAEAALREDENTDFSKEQPVSFHPSAAPAWLCACGTSNTGNFCMECGAKKSVLKTEEPSFWRCSCGAVNAGNFCSQCGNPDTTIPSTKQEEPPSLETLHENKPLEEDSSILQDVSFLNDIPILEEDLAEFNETPDTAEAPDTNYLDEEGNYNPNYDHYYDNRKPDYEAELEKWSIRSHWKLPAGIAVGIFIFIYYYIVLSSQFVK